MIGVELEKAEMTASRQSWKTIAYWIVTGFLALEILVGAGWDLSRHPHVVDVVTRLGYPVYLLMIVGAWKVLGGITLLVPKFPRLKEWAYAGVFFEMSGAAVSHLLAGDYSGIALPAFFSMLTLVSWALRPRSRRLSEVQE
jgi:hypothetical protein